VKRFSRDLILVGLAGSRLIEAGIDSGLRVANEGFPDRNYNPDGTLVSRKEANAIIQSPEEVAAAIESALQETVAELRRRGVTFEEYDFPGLKTVNGIATLETGRGITKAAWFKDSEGNILAVIQST